MKERKDGSSRKTEGWDGPSRPPVHGHVASVAFSWLRVRTCTFIARTHPALLHDKY